MTTHRPLRVFLCHSSNDKPAVRELYQKLRAEPWIQPWLDEEELFPGMDWNLEIEKAVEAADAIIVCLSKGSITKEGYVQRELRIVLDYADYKPEGALYLMPVRLEECEPPRRLRPWQYADYFEGQRERGLQRLLVSLKRRADSLDLSVETPALKKEEPVEVKKAVIDKPKPLPVPQISKNQKYTENGFLVEILGGIEFVRIPAGTFLMGSKDDNELAHRTEMPQHIVDIPYDYWMSRFPITNAQYSQFKKISFDKWEKARHPVVWVMWDDAMAYCKWLNNQIQNPEFRNQNLTFRLPTEAEWEKAARGTDGLEYPWGNSFDKNKCHVNTSSNNQLAPVDLYSPQGDSPYGCANMSGNVWEWTHSLEKSYPYIFNDGREDEKASGVRVQRGGSFAHDYREARCASRYQYLPNPTHVDIGFRICLAPPLPK